MQVEEWGSYAVGTGELWEHLQQQKRKKKKTGQEESKDEASRRQSTHLLVLCLIDSTDQCVESQETLVMGEAKEIKD